VVGGYPDLFNTIHRLIPNIIVVLVLMHVLRAVVSFNHSGTPTVKTGLISLILLAMVLGSGYVISYGGEAGYWGGIISVSVLLSFLSTAVLYTTTLLTFVGVESPSLLSYTTMSDLSGTTAFSQSVVLGFILTLHVCFSLAY